jgi:hypothetical protein
MKNTATKGKVTHLSQPLVSSSYHYFLNYINMFFMLRDSGHINLNTMYDDANTDRQQRQPNTEDNERLIPPRANGTRLTRPVWIAIFFVHISIPYNATLFSALTTMKTSTERRKRELQQA